MGLVDGFNHMEAVRAFRAAQALDPECAMCLWGEAYALGPNINKVMDPADNPRAVEAAQLALEKAAGASEVERALIEALQARYSDAPDADRAALDVAYSEAMQAVADRFPEHDQVAGARRGGDHGHPAVGLLGAGRPGGEGQRRAGAGAHGGGARAQPRPRAGDPPAHPPDRGVERPVAVAALCRRGSGA